MTKASQLYFLDFGLTNMHEGVLQGRILACDTEGGGLKTIFSGLRGMPGS